MELPVYYRILLWISILVTVMRPGSCQYNDMADDYAQYGDAADYYVQEPEEYMCYSCTFHLRQGTAAGLEECRDPFIKTGVPEVPCPGTCAKIYHKTSDTEYTISRVCLPNCRDVMDEKGYTQCCSGHLCNAGKAAFLCSQWAVMILAVLVAWFL